MVGLLKKDFLFIRPRRRIFPYALCLLVIALAVGGWFYFGRAQQPRPRPVAQFTPVAATPAVPPGKPVVGEIEPGQNLMPALQAVGVTENDANAAIDSLKAVEFPFRNIRPGQKFTAFVTEAQTLTALDYVLDRALRFEVRTQAGKFVARRIEEKTTLAVETIGARVKDCVYNAILEGGESDELASLVSNLFAWDIDFSTDPRTGDSFRLVFEKKRLANGEGLGYGRLLAGEFDGERTGKKQGFWLEVGNPDFDGFYDQNGMQLRKTFLRAPLDTMRITSRFGMRRHPILGRRMMHNGVDYGAPAGTPVWAVADGTVVSAGYNGAAGRMVRIRHDGGIESMYLHLSRITVRTGQRVRQRQLIGRVGTSGRSTGPHLDFRLTRGGAHLNPQTMKMYSQSKKLPEQYQAQFQQVIARLRPQLDAVALPPVPPPTAEPSDTDKADATPTP